MTRTRRSNPDFLNGVPELLILQLLAREPMYGYELVQAIKYATGSKLLFGEGCIYPILHRRAIATSSCSSRRDLVGGEQPNHVPADNQRAPANGCIRLSLEGSGQRGQPCLARGGRCRTIHGLRLCGRDLLRQGLPADYISRIVQELDDHIEDLFLEQEAIMHTEVQGTKADLIDVLEKQIGSREQLMDTAVAEYGKASFTGRHPIWMFLIAPIPAVILCWALFFLLACLAQEGLGLILEHGLGLIHRPVAEWPASFLWTVRHLHALGAFVPPAP